MGKMTLAYQNRSDGAVLSGGEWSEDLPLSNLQQRRLSKPARSVDAETGSTQFNVILDRERPIDVLVIPNHNLTTDAMYRIRAFNDSQMQDCAYDSGWVRLWSSIYSSLDLEWEDENLWWGQPSDEELKDYPHTWFCFLTQPVYAGFWKIEFDNTLNPDGYVQLARLMMSASWRPSVNMAYGSSLSWASDTTVEQSYGGSEFFHRKRPYRVARFKLDALMMDEGIRKPFELTRELGKDGEIFICLDPDDYQNLHRISFWGRLRELSPLEFPAFDTSSMAFEIKELM